MKKKILHILILLNCISFFSTENLISSAILDANNVRSFFSNTGTFNQGIYNNSPGFEWPKGSGKFLCFTSGFSITCKINGNLALVSGSYSGEWTPGYVIKSFGGVTGFTNNTFKIYSIKKSSTPYNNPDFENWHLMVPYGAPYDDVNGNCIYDPGIDKPGIKNASQTLFLSMTDAFIEQRNAGEGFGGGVTSPLLYAHVGMTAWAYNLPGLEDVQFIKWDVTNLGLKVWDEVNYGIFSHPTINPEIKDYIGFDENLNIAYAYSPELQSSSLAYPFFCQQVLQLPEYSVINFTTTDVFDSTAQCNFGYNSNPAGAINSMKGLKVDGTPFVNPLTMQVVNKVYTGHPFGGEGEWSEFKGSMLNCNGALTGTTIPENPPGRRTFVISISEENSVQTGEKRSITIAQFATRASSNQNSYTRMLSRGTILQILYPGMIDTCNLDNEINLPDKFSLSQNFPNPFNAGTKIQFKVPALGASVSFVISDVTGKIVDVISRKFYQNGNHELLYSPNNLSSGIYYYTMIAENEITRYSKTRKMVYLK